MCEIQIDKGVNCLIICKVAFILELCNQIIIFFIVSSIEWCVNFLPFLKCLLSKECDHTRLEIVRSFQLLVWKFIRWNAKLLIFIQVSHAIICCISYVNFLTDFIHISFISILFEYVQICIFSKHSFLSFFDFLSLTNLINISSFSRVNLKHGADNFLDVFFIATWNLFKHTFIDFFEKTQVGIWVEWVFQWAYLIE